jgi:hypothetical protein
MIRTRRAALRFLEPTKFSGWQVAPKGDWKNAKTINASPSPEEVTDALDWLKNVENDIAVEGLFHTESDELVFIGLDLNRRSTEEQSQLLKRLFETVVPEDDVMAVAAKLDDAGVGRLFDGKLSFLEVGVFNLWIDVGSQVVFRQSEDQILRFERLSPNLRQPQPRPIMLEAAWSEPCRHWLAVPISSKTEAGLYRSDMNRYRTAANAMLDF